MSEITGVSDDGMTYWNVTQGDYDALLAENQRLREERDEWELIAVRTSVEAGNEIRRIRAEALAGDAE